MTSLSIYYYLCYSHRTVTATDAQLMPCSYVFYETTFHTFTSTGQTTSHDCTIHPKLRLRSARPDILHYGRIGETWLTLLWCYLYELASVYSCTWTWWECMPTIWLEIGLCLVLIQAERTICWQGCSFGTIANHNIIMLCNIQTASSFWNLIRWGNTSKHCKCHCICPQKVLVSSVYSCTFIHSQFCKHAYFNSAYT